MNAHLTHFIGIDVAKEALDVHVLPEERSWSCPNNTQGFVQLLKQLPAPQTCLVVIEATGGYQRRLVAELTEAGHAVAVVNPRQVRDFARGLGILAKTDRLDAAVIARFGQQVQPRLVNQLPEKHAELEQLVARRRQLVVLRTAETNRLETTTAKRVAQSVRKIVQLLNKEIDAIEQAILKLLEADDDWNAKAKLLASVPGVGRITAATLVADLPELGKLNRQEIVALAGLAPYNRDSGRLKGKRSIWGGRQHVRSALYMAALTAKRCNPALKKFAQRLTEQGKQFKVVITACMRKLLVILNTMVKTNSHWNTI